MSQSPESLGPELARAADVLVRDMMCVVEGESVLITADSATDGRAVAALQNAAYQVGARVATLKPPAL